MDLWFRNVKLSGGFVEERRHMINSLMNTDCPRWIAHHVSTRERRGASNNQINCVCLLNNDVNVFLCETDALRTWIKQDFLFQSFISFVCLNCEVMIIENKLYAHQLQIHSERVWRKMQHSGKAVLWKNVILKCFIYVILHYIIIFLKTKRTNLQLNILLNNLI